MPSDSLSFRCCREAPGLDRTGFHMSLKNPDIAPGIAKEASRVLRLEGEAILLAAERFEAPEAQAQLGRALTVFKDALAAGGKIVVTGVGKSGKVGQKIAATFSSTGS